MTINALLVSPEKKIFKELETEFSKNNMTTQWADTAQEALAILSLEDFDLVISHEQLQDMSGHDFIEAVLFKNAMINSVVLSALTHDEFHDAYEGLGVLMQFSLKPDKKQVQNLLDHMDHITRIADRVSKSKGE